MDGRCSSPIYPPPPPPPLNNHGALFFIARICWPANPPSRMPGCSPRVWHETFQYGDILNNPPGHPFNGFIFRREKSVNPQRPLSFWQPKKVKDTQKGQNCQTNWNLSKGREDCDFLEEKTGPNFFRKRLYPTLHPAWRIIPGLGSVAS